MFILPLISFASYSNPLPNALDGIITHAFSATCSDGDIDLQINGGYPSYTLQWFKNNVAYGSQITSTGTDGLEDLANLLPGQYRVIVTDALCGEAEATFTVGVIPNVIIVNSVDHNSYCYEDSRGEFYASQDGSINVTINYSGTYTVAWSGIGYNSSSEDISGLCPGGYTLTITTSTGCTVTKQVKICCCEDLTNNVNSEIQNNSRSSCDLFFLFNDGEIPLCEDDLNYPIEIEEGNWASAKNGCDAFINPTVLGGSSSIIYNWSLPGGGTSTAHSLYNLCPGMYCLTATDGCSEDTRCWTIANCSEREILISSEIIHSCHDPSLGDFHIGAILLNISGGSAPYTFKWNNGVQTQNNTELASGNYCVTVSDNDHCTASQCFTINSPESEDQIVTEPCGRSYICNGSQILFDPSDPVVRPNGLFAEFIVNIDGFQFLWPTQCVEFEWCLGVPLGNTFTEIEYILHDVDEEANTCILSASCNNFPLFSNFSGTIEYGGDEDNCTKYCAVTMNAALLFPDENDPLAFLHEIDNYVVTYSYECIRREQGGNHCLVKGFCDGNLISEEIVPSCELCGDNGVECCQPSPPMVIGSEDHKESLYRYDTTNYSLNRIIELSSPIHLEKVEHKEANVNTGNKELNEKTDSVRVYPNPSSDAIYIELIAQSSQEITIRLFDNIGVLRKEQREFLSIGEKGKFKLDLANIPIGMYHLVILNERQLMHLQTLSVIK